MSYSESFCVLLTVLLIPTAMSRSRQRESMRAELRMTCAGLTPHLTKIAVKNSTQNSLTELKWHVTFTERQLKMTHSIVDKHVLGTLSPHPCALKQRKIYPI